MVHLHEENLAIGLMKNKVNSLRTLSILPKAREYVKMHDCSVFL